MHYARGMSLIELMIVVAILGIIAAIAWPTYEAQKQKQRRSDAIIALTNAAQKQERWYTLNGRYTNDIDDIGGAQSPQGYYQIAVQIPSTTGCSVNRGGDTYYYCYKLTATPQGIQAGDACGTLSLDHTGKKEASGGSVASCWGS